MTGGHRPERTCIGCRRVFGKEDVVRIVAVGDSAVIDYREKLGGRAAYVCPRPECVRRALVKELLARSLRTKIAVPTAEDFKAQLVSVIQDRIKSLLLMAAKAGKLATGYSAVLDCIETHRAEMIVFSKDVSEGTRDKIVHAARHIRQTTIFSKEEIGRMFGREAVGVAAIRDQGFADSVWRESERLKGLLNAGQ